MSVLVPPVPGLLAFAARIGYHHFFAFEQTGRP
jgi:hypothetical protein